MQGDVQRMSDYNKKRILIEGASKKGGINPGRVPPRPKTPPPNKKKKK